MLVDYHTELQVGNRVVLIRGPVKKAPFSLEGFLKLLPRVERFADVYLHVPGKGRLTVGGDWQDARNAKWYYYEFGLAKEGDKVKCVYIKSEKASRRDVKKFVGGVEGWANDSGR